MRSVTLPERDWSAIAEILSRRANDVASFKYDLEQDVGKKLNGFPGSVEMALSREVTRLRDLQGKIESKPNQEEEAE